MMSWLAEHAWLVPLLLNIILSLPFLWTLVNPGNGPDGAAEASFGFIIMIGGTAIVWGLYLVYFILAAIYVGLQT